ncbi:MAG: N-acetylmuramoyl-L-alanine amidase, partial [Candidatus Ornithomonoglobus sp.]
WLLRLLCLCDLRNCQTPVKTASDTLYLMKNPKPPAILVECGFITNPEEEKLLGTDEYRAKIAYAIADAVTPSP